MFFLKKNQIFSSDTFFLYKNFFKNIPNPFLPSRRGFNHSLNPSPIFGKGLNRSSCRSYIKVRSDHQRSGVIFYRLPHRHFSASR